MSAGHENPDWIPADTGKLKRIMENPDIEQYLWSHFQKIDMEHDLPYLAGYSEDGHTIYFDRHLPDQLEYVYDGNKKTFAPKTLVRPHEEWEKACIDILGLNYGSAHPIGNAAERRGVLAAGLMWIPYNQCLEPYIKKDEHEKLVKVPADLDMSPYLFPPIDHLLLKHMRKAMGKRNV